jgi:hypothetical protein
VFWVGTNVVGKEGLHVCMCIERNRGIPKNGVFWINVYIYIYIYGSDPYTHTTQQ